jgi:hypothetical protein
MNQTTNVEGFACYYALGCEVRPIGVSTAALINAWNHHDQTSVSNFQLRLSNFFGEAEGSSPNYQKRSTVTHRRGKLASNHGSTN